MKENRLDALVKIVKRFSKGSRRYFCLAVLASLAYTGCNTVMPQIFKITVDSIIGDAPFDLPTKIVGVIEAIGGRDFLKNNLGYLAVALFVIALLGGISNFTSRTAIATGAERFVKQMRDSLFLHIQNLPFSWHIAHQTGDIIQRVTSDMDVVRSFISMHLIEAFRTTMLLIVTLYMMFSMNARLSLVAVAFVPFIVAYSAIFYTAIAKRFRRTDEAEGVLSSVVQENLTGVRVVRAFGREGFEMNKFDEKNQDFASIWIKLGYTMGAYWGFGDLFTGLQTLAVIVCGTIWTVQGSMSVGELIAFLSYNSMIIWPIRGLGRILSEMSKSSVSFERIAYILDAQEEQDAPDAVEPSMNGDIVYENALLCYNAENNVINNISFTIEGGTTFGILGGTGSGKSTLIHALNRLHPLTSGEITIGGVNINHIKLPHLRSNIGMVLQEPFLFSKTIQENVGIGTKSYDLKEIRKVSSIACVDEAIIGFPQGYDTIVGERGVTLSGGQKQRVAIARMLMQKAPIMIFDDSLSAVDSETDYKIRKALKENLGQSTVILISHRITTLMQADKILVLDEGKISQIGTHAELVAQDGIYKQIYDIQLNSDDRKLAMGGAE